MGSTDNICEMHGDEFNPDWWQSDAYDDDQPGELPQLQHDDMLLKTTRAAITVWMAAGN